MGELASQQFEFPVGNSRTAERQRAEQTQCRAEQSCVCWHHAPAAIMHPTHVLCSWAQYMRSISTIFCLFRVRSRTFDLEFGWKRRERMKFRMLINLVTGGLCWRALWGSIPLATHTYTVCYPCARALWSGLELTGPDWMGANRESKIMPNKGEKICRHILQST